MSARVRPETVLVVGGTRGIGRAVAVEYGRRAATVLVAGRSAEAGAETVARVRAAGGEARFVECDVTDPDLVARAFRRMREGVAELSVAVNCAGTLPPPGRLLDEPEDAWADVLATNLTGVWRCLREELRWMSGQGTGAIVNVASVFGLRGAAGFASYAAAKHAVVGLTRSLALETASEGIRVNAVCPSTVDTGMVRRIATDAALRGKAERHPAGRFPTVGEVARAVVWLGSADAGFVSGHALVVDGGLTVAAP